MHSVANFAAGNSYVKKLPYFTAEIAVRNAECKRNAVIVLFSRYKSKHADPETSQRVHTSQRRTTVPLRHTESSAHNYKAASPLRTRKGKARTHRTILKKGLRSKVAPNPRTGRTEVLNATRSVAPHAKQVFFFSLSLPK